MKKDFLTITDFTTEEIKETFQLALDMKSKKTAPLPLKGKVVACIILKSSLRTRFSFGVGIAQFEYQKSEGTNKTLDFGKVIFYKICTRWPDLENL